MRYCEGACLLWRSQFLDCPIHTDYFIALFEDLFEDWVCLM